MAVGPWHGRSAHGAHVVFNVSHMPHRFFVWSSAPPGPSMPSAGGRVDGVAGYEGNTANAAGAGYCAVPGWPFEVEAGGTFSAGADLATDSSGRAVAAGSSARIVARALEGATSGNVVWAVFVTAHETG